MADFTVKITLAASSPMPTYSVAPWESGVLRMASGDATGSDLSGLLTDLSPIGEYADIARGGNYAAIEDWSFAMMAAYGGAKWWLAFGAAGASMLGATVEVIDTTAAITRAVGVVTEAKLAGAEVSVTCESVATKRHKEIPTRRITSIEFPGLTEQFEGAVVPIVYGPAERMEPASFLTEPEYIPSLEIFTGGGYISRSSTFISNHAGVASPTATLAPIAVAISTPDPPPDAADAFSVGKLYLLISAGAGSGQERKVSAISYTSGTTPDGEFQVCANMTLAVPLETLPDATSEIRLIRREVGAVLAVCDEGVVSQVRDAEYDSLTPFAQITVATGIVAADISAEFASGESYQSIDYQKPGENFGIIALTDGLSAGSPNVARGYGIGEYSNGEICAELFCRSRIDLSSVDNETIDKNPDVYGLVSMEVLGYPAEEIEAIYLQAKAIRWDGSVEQIGVVTDISLIPGKAVNCYSPAMASDGVPGNFAGYAARLSLERPVSHYKSILVGATFRGALTYIIGEDRYTPQPIFADGPVTFVNGQDYIIWDAAVSSDYAHGRNPLLDDLQWVSPFDDSYPTTSGFYTDRIRDFTDPYAGLAAQDMYQVTAITFISGTTYRVNLDKVISCQSGTYSARFVSQYIIDTSEGVGPPVQVNEYESGIAFVFGEIPQNSTFLANMTSGRTTSGAPITLAKDAAVNIMERDLGLTSAEVDEASFTALPDDTIRMAIAEAENSGEIIARMAREFNWIVGHDGTGKERAKTWLDRVGTPDVDWAVSSADILEDSLSQSTTSIGDVICEPRTEWDWTVADGFRKSGYITDITTLPASLTADNYLRTISGFGDYATSLSVFTALHNAYKDVLERGPQAVEYQYGGDPATLYVGDLAAWCAARKLLLDFKVSEAAAAAACVVGDRIAIAHKRATNNATKYGTICGRWWHPMDGAVQILAMMDPE